MSTMIEQMLSKYNIENLYDHKNAMKEIMRKLFYADCPVRDSLRRQLFTEALHFGFFTGLTDFRKT